MDWNDLYNYTGGTGTRNKYRLIGGGPELIVPGEEILVPRYEREMEGRSGTINGYVQARPVGEPRSHGHLLVRTIASKDGAAVPGATVQLQQSGRVIRSNRSTDDAGEIIFESVSPGTYTVQASHDGSQLVDPQSVTGDVEVGTVNQIDVRVRSTPSMDIVRAPRNPGETVTNLEPAEFVRIGLWDRAYETRKSWPPGTHEMNVKNEDLEERNFIDLDTRRFYFRVYDPSVPPDKRYVHINWKTLHNNGHDDCAPPSQRLTLKRTRRESSWFVSRAVMLTSDDTDQNYPTATGHEDSAEDPGSTSGWSLKHSGESNHRMRRVSKLGGFVQGEYVPASGGEPLSAKAKTFHPEELRRLPLHIVNYRHRVGRNRGTPCVNRDHINEQVNVVNTRWKQVGLEAYWEERTYQERDLPAGAVNGNGRFPVADPWSRRYKHARNALLEDLLPNTPDNTVTAVFAPIQGALGIALSIENNIPYNLENKHFALLNARPAFDQDDYTLAHELHHLLFNRGDTPTRDQYFTFNTQSDSALLYHPSPLSRASWPDVRLQRRIQNADTPDLTVTDTHPDNDPDCKNILNWIRRERPGPRHPPAEGNEPATDTTGNRDLLETWNPYERY